MTQLRTALALAGVFLAAAALANISINAEFPKVAKPPKDSALAKAGCVTCHPAGKTTLNAYGKDLSVAMKALKTKKLTPEVLKKTAKLDSDKDKFTNEKEIKAGTLPGDPKSKPAK